MHRSINYLKLALGIYVLLQIRQVWVNYSRDPLSYGLVFIMLGMLFVIFNHRMKTNAPIPYLPRMVDFLLVTTMNLLAGPFFIIWYMFLAVNAILTIHNKSHYWYVGMYYLGYIIFVREWGWSLSISSLGLLVLDSIGFAFTILFGYYLRFIFTHVHKTNLLYTELKQSHEQLEQYAREVEALGAMQERTRIAREIHDSLGHTLTALIMQLEAGEMALTDEASIAKERIARARTLAQESMLNLREAVRALRQESIQDFEENIWGIAASLGLPESGFSLSVSGDFRHLTAQVQLCLLRLIQEGLTNAVRHGKATQVTVKLICDAEVSLFIQDNGVGTPEIKKGFGLKGMEERIQELGGTINLDSIPGQGFQVRVVLPNKRRAEDGQNSDTAG